MRILKSSVDPALATLHPVALILVALALPIRSVAGLTLGLALLVAIVLVVTFSSLLPILLAPLVLARPWRLGRLCWPERFVWSWLRVTGEQDT